MTKLDKLDIWLVIVALTVIQHLTGIILSIVFMSVWPVIVTCSVLVAVCISWQIWAMFDCASSDKKKLMKTIE